MDALGIVEDEAWELSRVRAFEDAVMDDDERPLPGSLPHLMLLEHARRTAYDAVVGFGTLYPRWRIPRWRKRRRHVAIFPALGTGRRRQWRSQC